MHQEYIMNEQNLCKTLREISETIQIEDHTSRIDHEWANFRQKVWGKIWKLFKLKILHQESIMKEQNSSKILKKI